MDIAVRTGSTKAPRDLSLVSLSLESLHGERVCLVMDITAREKESQAIERECEAIVKHAILDAEGDAAERLDGALKEMNGLLKGMLVSGAVHDAHVIVSILDNEGFMHVSHAGRAEAYLIRRGSASQITEYSGGKPTPAFVHIASGKLEPGDLVLLSTQRLLRTLTPAQLARLTSDRDMVVESLTRALEGEGEHAALAVVAVRGKRGEEEAEAYVPPVRRQSEERSPLLDRRRRMQAQSMASRFKIPSFSAIRLPSMESIRGLFSRLPSLPSMDSVRDAGKSAGKRGASSAAAIGGVWGSFQAWATNFIADLRHPQRKKRAHLLLIAGAIGVLLIVWAIVQIYTSTQRSQTRAQLEELVAQINTDIQTAENRSLNGDKDAANTILDRAETRAKQVMDNESGLFRAESNELLGRIRSKKEEINNITRLTPRVLANLATDNPDILALGLIGVGEGEFVAYDKQDAYRVLLNSVEDGSRLSDDVLVVDGANFARFGTQVFLMNGNSVIEWQDGQATVMKTDDTRGWVNGVAADAYLRYFYVLSPDAKQIYRYERLSGKYGVPVEYNVNGDLTGAIDFSIDGNVYVLKKAADGTKSILKLFRGETQPFVIRQAPAGLLDNATKILKLTDGNFYALDPENKRVIVFSDGGETGESAYMRQYVLEGEQVTDLKDIYVNSDETQLYVLDEKQIYVIELIR